MFPLSDGVMADTALGEGIHVDALGHELCSVTKNYKANRLA